MHDIREERQEEEEEKQEEEEEKQEEEEETSFDWDGYDNKLIT